MPRTRTGRWSRRYAQRAAISPVGADQLTQHRAAPYRVLDIRVLVTSPAPSRSGNRAHRGSGQQRTKREQP